MTLADRVAEWPKPYIQQGREEGMRLGREEGIRLAREEGIRLGREESIAQQRLMLRRQTALRFGPAAADRLARALATETNPERLSTVAEAIVRCTTSDELLRVAATAP